MPAMVRLSLPLLSLGIDGPVGGPRLFAAGPMGLGNWLLVGPLGGMETGGGACLGPPLF